MILAVLSRTVLLRTVLAWSALAVVEDLSEQTDAGVGEACQLLDAQTVLFPEDVCQLILLVYAERIGRRLAEYFDAEVRDGGGHLAVSVAGPPEDSGCQLHLHTVVAREEVEHPDRAAEYLLDGAVVYVAFRADESVGRYGVVSRQLSAGTEQFLLPPLAHVRDICDRPVGCQRVAVVEIQRTGAPSVMCRENGQSGCGRVAQDVGNRPFKVLSIVNFFHADVCAAHVGQSEKSLPVGLDESAAILFGAVDYEMDMVVHQAESVHGYVSVSHACRNAVHPENVIGVSLENDFFFQSGCADVPEMFLLLHNLSLLSVNNCLKVRNYILTVQQW